MAEEGNYHRQKIWFAECSDLNLIYPDRDCAFDPTPLAIDTMDQWLSNLRSDTKSKRVPPAQAQDTCFDSQGNIIYSGSDAWNGIIDDKASGPCSEYFPLNSTSRIIAGDSIKGDTFKCALKSLQSAVTDGDYGDVQFTATQLSILSQIFPDGVCDYGIDDIDKP